MDRSGSGFAANAKERLERVEGEEDGFCHQCMPINKYCSRLTGMAVVDPAAPFRFMNDIIISIRKSNGVRCVFDGCWRTASQPFVIIAAVVGMVPGIVDITAVNPVAVLRQNAGFAAEPIPASYMVRTEKTPFLMSEYLAYRFARGAYPKAMNISAQVGKSPEVLQVLLFQLMPFWLVGG